MLCILEILSMGLENVQHVEMEMLYLDIVEHSLILKESQGSEMVLMDLEMVNL